MSTFLEDLKKNGVVEKGPNKNSGHVEVNPLRKDVANLANSNFELRHHKFVGVGNKEINFEEHVKFLHGYVKEGDKERDIRNAVMTDAKRTKVVNSLRSEYRHLVSKSDEEDVRYYVNSSGEFKREVENCQTINGDIVDISQLELRVGSAKLSVVLDSTAGFASRIPCNEKLLREICKEINDYQVTNNNIKKEQSYLQESIIKKLEEAVACEEKMKSILKIEDLEKELRAKEPHDQVSARLGKIEKELKDARSADVLDQVKIKQLEAEMSQTKITLEEITKLQEIISQPEKMKRLIFNDILAEIGKRESKLLKQFNKTPEDDILKDLKSALGIAENKSGSSILSKNLCEALKDLKSSQIAPQKLTQEENKFLNRMVRKMQEGGILHYAKLEGFELEPSTTIAGEYQGIQLKDMTIRGTVSLNLKTRGELDPNADLKITPKLTDCIVDCGAFYGNLGDMELIREKRRYAVVFRGADLNGPGAGSDWSKMTNYNPDDLKFEYSYRGGRHGFFRGDLLNGISKSLNYVSFKFYLGVRQPCMGHKVFFGEGSPMDRHMGSYQGRTLREKIKFRWKATSLIFDPSAANPNQTPDKPSGANFSEATKKAMFGLVRPVKLPNVHSAVMLKEFYKRDGSVLTCEVNKNIFYIEAADTSHRGAYIAQTTDPNKIAVAILDESYKVRQEFICDIVEVAKALEEMRLVDVRERIKRTRPQMNTALDAIVVASKKIDDSSMKSLFDIAFKNFLYSN